MLNQINWLQKSKFSYNSRVSSFFHRSLTNYHPNCILFNYVLVESHSTKHSHLFVPKIMPVVLYSDSKQFLCDVCVGGQRLRLTPACGSAVPMVNRMSRGVQLAQATAIGVLASGIDAADLRQRSATFCSLSW